MLDIQIQGLFGLILLALVIWAVVSVLQSRATTGRKVLWILFVVIFPFFGFVIWLLFGPRSWRELS